MTTRADDPWSLALDVRTTAELRRQDSPAQTRITRRIGVSLRPGNPSLRERRHVVQRNVPAPT
jgi:hypothetical protein